MIEGEVRTKEFAWARQFIQIDVYCLYCWIFWCQWDTVASVIGLQVNRDSVILVSRCVTYHFHFKWGMSGLR